MAYFFLKLIPPRATFPQDMTGEEAAMMREHVAYWQKLIAEGTHVVALGPVFDPTAPFGMGVIEVGDDELRGLTANDPAIKANRGMRYESYPMPRGVIHS